MLPAARGGPGQRPGFAARDFTARHLTARDFFAVEAGILRDSDPTGALPAHPEEIKAVGSVRIGERVTLAGSARITPAGIVTVGITAVAVLASWYLLERYVRK